MYFVVAIDLDTEKTDYKVFEKYEDALKRFNAAWVRSFDGKPVTSRTSGEEAWIEAARLYRADAQSPEGAKEIVENGKGELLEDSERLFDIEIDI
jgi:hypothetical protein